MVREGYSGDCQVDRGGSQLGGFLCEEIYLGVRPSERNWLSKSHTTRSSAFDIKSREQSLQQLHDVRQTWGRTGKTSRLRTAEDHCLGANMVYETWITSCSIAGGKAATEEKRHHTPYYYVVYYSMLLCMAGRLHRLHR